MTKEEALKAILDEIFKLNLPKIDESRRDVIHNFIATTINGDNPSSYLAVNAGLSENKEGVISYILTDKRLIKIDIDSKGSAESLTYPLNTIIGVERKLDQDRILFNISFQKGSFGLEYPQSSKKITDFFQEIENLATRG